MGGTLLDGTAWIHKRTATNGGRYPGNAGEDDRGGAEDDGDAAGDEEDGEDVVVGFEGVCGAEARAWHHSGDHPASLPQIGNPHVTRRSRRGPRLAPFAPSTSSTSSPTSRN